MSRTAVAVALSVGVVILAVVIVVASLVPLPQYEPLPAGVFSSSLAFVGEDNCVHLADLADATTTELRCEPDQGWIDELAWTAEGIEITTYLNQPTTRVVDPATGEITETRVGDEVISEGPDGSVGLVVDHPNEDTIVIYDEHDEELFTVQGPERYWIEAAVPRGDDGPVAIADSVGRLAVFSRADLEPYLVADDVRTWPYPVWEP